MTTTIIKWMTTSPMSTVRTFVTCQMLDFWGHRTHQHKKYQLHCLEYTGAERRMKIFRVRRVEKDIRSLASLMMQKMGSQKQCFNSVSYEAHTLILCVCFFEADCQLSPMPSAAYHLWISMPEAKRPLGRYNISITSCATPFPGLLSHIHTVTFTLFSTIITHCKQP